MRIVGQIEHPVIKITVMQMNNRYVLKLEANMLEQTYKFNEDDNLRTMADIEMNKSRGETYQRNIL